MTRNVTIVELSLYERMVPLLGGYLEAYARQDPLLESSYRFHKLGLTNRTPQDSLLRLLSDTAADIYAFSCYVWNARLIMSVLPGLREARPTAQIMLGGPQVMHHAHRYLRPEHENVVVCNGEGEKTFADYLRASTEVRPDFSNVRGISFYRDGELITTAPQERLTALAQAPSPFLTGLFEEDYSTTVFETNRGCPFHCGFCYWGAATNDRVFKFSEERIQDEITWMSKKGIVHVFIADANWGMLKRDIELSRHFANCKKERGAPSIVYYSAAKNSPDRVTEITEIFQKAQI